jgi:Mlc titration factor MtfA (ptsG expression regulator)
MATCIDCRLVVSEVAEMMNVFRPTAYKCSKRWQSEGDAGLRDGPMDPAESLRVATEAVFDVSVALQRHEPKLYEVMHHFTNRTRPLAPAEQNDRHDTHCSSWAGRNIP